MRFGSVCSGIEAASVAWEPLGWKAAWFSEIEPFPSAVLAHHYPETPNLGDMTEIPALLALGEVEAPDILCGGTPCQAFSVAGLRRSLDDARGNLSLTFCEIANAIDHARAARGEQPCIVFWENVPGVLNTKDNAFGCFLAGLAGEDDPLVAPGGKWSNSGVVLGPQRAVAWRILDAQYFGLAQRRRRVFVVASSREGFDPAAVLLEWDGVRRDTAPSREAGKVAPTIPSRSTAGGGLGTDFDCDGGVVQVCPTLRAGGNQTGGDRPPGTDVDTADSLIPVPVQPVTYDFFNITAPVNRQSRTPGDPCHTLARSNAEHAVVMGPVAQPMFLHVNKGRPDGRQSAHEEMVTVKPIVETLTTDGHARSAVAQPIAFPANLSGTQCASSENIAPAMGAKNPTAVAWGISNQPTPKFGGNVCPSLDAKTSGGGRMEAVAVAMQVRRLTPVECERLQGFPDGYTAIPWRNKPASECPDGPRYKALGNSWAVPVVRWIGWRIDTLANLV